MIRPDIPLMAGQLNSLAEVFDKKPLGEKAAMVWYDTLCDFATEKVMSVLIAWPRSHTKFPAPAEVRKVLSEMLSDDIERKAAVERKAQPFENLVVGSAQAEKFIAEIRRTLNKPRWTPREHWERLLARSKPESIGHRYATEALKKMRAHSQREPGEDDA